MQGGGARERGWPIAAALAVAALVLHVARLELIPFVLAAILGFVFDPPIRWLQERTRAPRWVVASALFLILMAAILALAVGVGLDTGRDAAAMANAGPSALHEVLGKALGPRGVTLFGQTFTADGVSAAIAGQARRLLDFGLVAKLAPPAAAVLIGLVALALLTFYAMLSGPELAAGALWLVPPSRRAGVERVAPAMVKVAQRYFIGVAAIAGFTILMAWIGYALVLHVKGAALLAVVVGLLETVPAVGPAIAAVLVTLAALQLHSLVGMAVMIGYAMALRLCVDDLLAPIVLGKSVTVHPVVVMLAYLLGAVLFGLIGVLLAVPAAACVRIALADAYERRSPS